MKFDRRMKWGCVAHIPAEYFLARLLLIERECLFTFLESFVDMLEGGDAVPAKVVRGLLKILFRFAQVHHSRRNLGVSFLLLRHLYPFEFRSTLWLGCGGQTDSASECDSTQNGDSLVHGMAFLGGLDWDSREAM
jgi:hypothetical protein